MLRQLRTEHLYLAAAEEIRRYIIESGLVPGDRLPSEHMLCERLAIGRTSLREALRLLQMDGVIDIKAGRGAYVRRNDFESFLERASVPLLNDFSDVAALSEVREILEVASVERAAVNRTQEHLNALEERLRRDEELVGQGHYRLDDDIDFHRLLFEAAGNKVLLRFVQLIREATRSVYEEHLLSPAAARTTLAEHTAIYRAVRDKKPAKAATEIRNHLQATADTILAHMRANEEYQVMAAATATHLSE